MQAETSDNTIPTPTTILDNYTKNMIFFQNRVSQPTLLIKK